MEPDALREQLAKLHQELGSTSHVDAASSSLLADLMQDIKRLMDQPSGLSAIDPAASAGKQRAQENAAAPTLPDRLELVAVQFEAKHPTLAASSRRLIDILGKAGL